MTTPPPPTTATTTKATEVDDLFSSFLEEIKSVETKSVEAADEEDDKEPRRAKRAKAVVAVAAAAVAQPSTDFREAKKPRTGGFSVPAGGASSSSYLTDYQKQQSTYTYNPSISQKQSSTHAAANVTESLHSEAEAKPAVAGDKSDGKKKFVRMAAGKTWVDSTLGAWPQNDYRLFIGDLGNETTDEQLSRYFRDKYPSFAMAKIVRDRNGKTKGYGFVSFLDGFEMLAAMRQENGKYLGSRPMKIRKCDWKERDAGVVKKKIAAEKKKKRAMGLL